MIQFGHEFGCWHTEDARLYFQFLVTLLPHQKARTIIERDEWGRIVKSRTLAL